MVVKSALLLSYAIYSLAYSLSDSTQPSTHLQMTDSSTKAVNKRHESVNKHTLYILSIILSRTTTFRNNTPKKIHKYPHQFTIRFLIDAVGVPDTTASLSRSGRRKSDSYNSSCALARSSGFITRHLIIPDYQDKTNTINNRTHLSMNFTQSVDKFEGIAGGVFEVAT
jgi:hypothetical protein